jgi:hypothetical protein
LGLNKCPDCDGEVSDRASACPHCGAPMTDSSDSKKPEKVVVVDGTVAAGAEAGRGCAMFFASTFMAFVIFFVTWMVCVTYIANRAGALKEGETPSLWVGFFLFIAPVIVAIAGRKVIRRVIPIVMSSALLIVVVIVGLLVLLTGASVFLSGLHWPGAH